MSDRPTAYPGPDFRDPAQRRAAVSGLTRRRAERGLAVSHPVEKKAA
jgi:hypothetical protein